MTAATPTAERPIRIVITGGGTGGHVFPAIAIANALKSTEQSVELLYIGKNNSLETEVASKNGIRFLGLDCSGMPRKPGLALIKWFLTMQSAKANAKKMLTTFEPDVVFGTGGYVSAPVMLAAQELKIPTILHEPDAIPGLANRLLGKKADCITAAFAQSQTLFKQKSGAQFLVTGNPVRTDILNWDKSTALKHLSLPWPPEQKILLVFGGSQGAHSINQALVEALPSLLDSEGLGCGKLNIIHLSGKNAYDDTLALLPESLKTAEQRLAKGYYLEPFSYEMPALLAASDLALCRSGSMSLSELYLAGLPSILVPYPFAASDHQRKNAEASVEAGASRMVQDQELSKDRLLAAIKELCNSPQTLEKLKLASLKLAHPDATQQITAQILRLAKK